MSNQLISILMPVKNAGIFLSQTLDSILAQHEEHWELIAVDDHSTDHSIEILKSYAEKDQRIRVYNNSGQGIISALRLAFEQFEGVFITRMDADDLMLPEKLQHLKALLEEKGKGYVATGRVEYFSEDQLGEGYQKYAAWLNQLMEEERSFEEIYKECVIPSPNWMLYREDLEKCGAFDHDLYPEDYDLCFRFYQQGLKVIASDKLLHRWRDYPERTSRNDEKYLDNNFFDLKVNYFLQIDRKEQQPLVLWGAGGKGKAIAKFLLEKKIPFRWLCNNPNKIGQSIYDVLLENQELVEEMKDPQVIVALSSPEDQKKVEERLRLKKMMPGKDYFFFC